MTAPTAAEIRTSVETRRDEEREGRLSLAGEFSDAFGAAAAVVGGLWNIDDFRESELDRYDELLSTAVQRVHRESERLLLDALVSALVTFAGEHPDAPRA